MRLGQLRCGRPARSVTAAVPSTPTHCFGVRMATREITELQRIFQSRLDTLDHLLDVGGKHLDLEADLPERLAPDILPLGSPVALASNHPRGFTQWCDGTPGANRPWGVQTG